MALGFPQFGDSHQRGFHNKSSRTATGKGWGRHDFYGGEDAGDDSEGASDEDRTLKEAKKLEERLGCSPGLWGFLKISVMKSGTMSHD
jgi:hypothetical protein